MSENFRDFNGVLAIVEMQKKRGGKSVILPRLMGAWLKEALENEGLKVNIGFKGTEITWGNDE